MHVINYNNKKIAKMNITKKFLQLTSRTYPHGTEQEIFHLLPKSLKEDEFGNLFIKIGESDAMFTSHLDTATKANTDVVHIFDGDIIKTDGKSILGADDKAGVTIMLNMIEKNIPGLYYFFLGEEVGCIGSRKVADVQKVEKIPGINKVISFDRRSTDSIITFQSSKRCCSDTFGDALAKAFNDVEETFSYKLDKNGVLTDSIQFISIYPECTNISVGYYSEHTFSERQDIAHLTKLAEACLKVDWASLPVERDPSKIEYDYSWGAYGGAYGDGDWGAWGSSRYDTGNYTNAYASTNVMDDYSSTRTRQQGAYRVKTEKSYFYDELFQYLSMIETNATTGKIVKVELIEDRIKYESQLITRLFKDIELHYTKLEWDGFKCTVFYESEHRTECDRNDLLEYLPDLDYRGIEILGDYDDSVYMC